MRRIALLAALSSLLAACFSPELGPTPFACKTSPRCPEGYRCVEGVCRLEAPSPELAVVDLDGGSDADRGTGDRPRTEGPRPDQRQGDGPKPPKPDGPKPDAPRPPDNPPIATPGFVVVPKGTFTMGSPTSEACRRGDETQHLVTLTHAFEIMQTEVTQTQFQGLMGYNSSQNKCTSCPVEMVQWNEAAAYANALSAKAGLTACYSCSGGVCSEAAAYAGASIYGCPGFRLPTEAEWERAYRAGTTTAYHNNAQSTPASCDFGPLDPNLDKIAWYFLNTTGPKGVSLKQANGWGLHDMSGNVAEWVHDYYGGDLGSAAVTDPPGVPASAAAVDGSNKMRVARGGAFNNAVEDLRAASRRGRGTGNSQYTEIGFRIARTR